MSPDTLSAYCHSQLIVAMRSLQHVTSCFLRSCESPNSFFKFPGTACMATPAEQLESFLVAKEIFDLLRAAGVESISDYIGLYAESEYEDGLKEWTDKSTNFQGNKIQLSRLRIAWATGRKELLRDTPAGATDDADLEAPLPVDVRKKQDEVFQQKYQLKLPLELTPAPPLFNRHFREFRKQAKTLDELAKVKSALDTSLSSSQSSKATFPDALAFLRAHQVLLNSWAMTATSDRQSKLHVQSTMVTDFSLSDALAYHVFVTDRLRAHPGPAEAAIQWTLDRDRQTRQAALSLYAEGWPTCEALRVAREQKTAVLWQIGPVGALADAQARPAKRPKTGPAGPQIDPSTHIAFDEADLCKKWNDGKCTKRQKDCPDQKLHRCSFRMASGCLCGAWQHS